MIVKYVKGDLITMIDNNVAGKTDELLYAAHGCNCFCTQGSGIAGQLRKFPEIYEADVKYGKKGHISKLGKFSDVIICDSVLVVNMYTQYKYGVVKRHANYAAIAKVFSHLNDPCIGASKRFTMYIPKIGSDLAGGDWEIISLIIDDATPDLDIIVLEFEPGTDPRGES